MSVLHTLPSPAVSSGVAKCCEMEGKKICFGVEIIDILKGGERTEITFFTEALKCAKCSMGRTEDKCEG